MPVSYTKTKYTLRRHLVWHYGIGRGIYVSILIVTSTGLPLLQTILTSKKCGSCKVEIETPEKTDLLHGAAGSANRSLMPAELLNRYRSFVLQSLGSHITVLVGRRDSFLASDLFVFREHPSSRSINTKCRIITGGLARQLFSVLSYHFSYGPVAQS